MLIKHQTVIRTQSMKKQIRAGNGEWWELEQSYVRRAAQEDFLEEVTSEWRRGCLEGPAGDNCHAKALR